MKSWITIPLFADYLKCFAVKIDVNAIPTLEQVLGKPSSECTYIEAIALAKMALMISPRNPEFHFGLACFYDALDQRYNVLKHLRKAIAYGMDKQRILTAHSLQALLQTDKCFKKLIKKL